MGYTTPSAEFNQYKKRFGANPFVYSWDLAGHSTMQFPEQNVFGLYVTSQGYIAKVCYSWLEAAEVLQWYYNLEK